MAIATKIEYNRAFKNSFFRILFIPLTYLVQIQKQFISIYSRSPRTLYIVFHNEIKITQSIMINKTFGPNQTNRPIKRTNAQMIAMVNNNDLKKFGIFINNYLIIPSSRQNARASSRFTCGLGLSIE